MSKLPSLYQQQTKICAKCKVPKDLNAFSKLKRSKDGLQFRCKECFNLDAREYRNASSDRQKKHRDREAQRAKDGKREWREGHLKRKYGIDIDDYDKMLQDQNGVCKICKNPQKSRRLSVDHCHTTNSVRGLLCDNCNHGVGKFKDNPNLLIAAASYLKESLNV